MATVSRWHGYTIDDQDSLSVPINDQASYGFHPEDSRLTLKINHATGQPYHGFFGFPDLMQHSGLLRFRLSSLPDGTNTLFYGLQAESPYGNTFRVLLTSTGGLRFQGGDNANVSPDIHFATSVVAERDYTVKWQIDSTEGIISVRLFDEDGEISTEKTSTGTFGPFGNLRIGPRLSSPIVPPYYVWDTIITDNLEWIDWDPEVPVAPSKNLAVIGDSLTYQSLEGFGNLTTYLSGYEVSEGALFYQGASGKEISVPDYLGRDLLTIDIPTARRNLGVVDTWVIALGTNDMLQAGSEANFKARITSVLEALKDERRVLWVGLAAGDPGISFETYNTYIRSVVSNYPNVEFLEFEQSSRDPYIAGDWVFPTDNLHMTQQGYLRRSKFVVDNLEEPDPHPTQPWTSVRIGDDVVTAMYVGSDLVWKA